MDVISKAWVVFLSRRSMNGSPFIVVEADNGGFLSLRNAIDRVKVKLGDALEDGEARIVGATPLHVLERWDDED